MPQFSLFISAASFSGTGDFSKKEFNIKTEELNEARLYFKDCNKLYHRLNEIYDTPIWQGHDFAALVHAPESPLDRDHKAILSKLIDRAKDSELTEAQFYRNATPTPKDVWSLLTTKSINNLPSDQHINSYKSAVQHLRHFTGIFHGTEDEFAEEITILFNKIKFSNDIATSLSTLEGGLEKFSKTIIYILSHLNDEFIHYYAPSKRADSIQMLASNLKIETTLDKNHSARQKAKLTFEFDKINISGTSPESTMIYCEPHCKLLKSDVAGDSHPYFNRIYFRETHDEFPGYLLIGHIGKHN